LNANQLEDLIEQYFQAFQPANVDARKLVKAIAMMESSGGKNCQRRHEKAYCTGVYSTAAAVVRLTSLYGHSAHCSYGPWQILLVNCPAGMAPTQLRDADECARATADYLTRLNVRPRPQTVEQWGQVWNGGHVGASNPGVDAYVALVIMAAYTRSGVGAAWGAFTPVSVISNDRLSLFKLDWRIPA
jgi:hypothetical protein